MIIDFHTHIFPPRIKKDRSHYIQSDPCFADLYSNRNARLATADELIASMDKAGIDVSVVLNIDWSNRNTCIETNDYILESVDRYRGRLVGFCAFPPDSPDSAAAEIERCAVAGIKGVGEMRPDFALRDKDWMKPVAEFIEKHRLVLLTHASEPVGHLYRGKGVITPARLYPFIIEYPGLTLVCSHWGGGLPFYALMPEVKEAMSNVYFDTAASSLLYSPEVYERVIELVGEDKVLFGSDYPLLSQSRILDEINSRDLPPSARDLILSGNARKLTGI